MSSDPPPLMPADAAGAPTWRAAYSDRTALLMAKFAQYAYLPFFASPTAKLVDPAGMAQLAGLIAPGGFALTGLFSQGDSQALLAVHPTQMAVLAFRGTANAGDWSINLDAGLMPMPGFDRVRVHAGFWGAYAATAEAVRVAVDALPAGLGLYITGHSLGGALAQIAAAVLERDTLAACYTFGSPRVATLVFDDEVKCPHYRLVDNWDLVPGVPAPLLDGYRHTGDPRLLKGVSPIQALRRDRAVGPRLAIDLWSLLTWPVRRRITVVDDHMIWNYRARLESIAAARAPKP